MTQQVEASQQNELLFIVLDLLLTIFKYDYSALGKSSWIY